MNFVALDYRFNFGLILGDISGKRFVLAGLVAFLILLILAVTSTKSWVGYLGKNWQRLHWLVYVAGVLAVTHFLWQVKADTREPLIYGALVAFLLLLRAPPIRRFISKIQGSSGDSKREDVS